MNGAFDKPVIPRGRANDEVRSPTIVSNAERDGVIKFHRTATGRDYMSARDFKRLLEYADRMAGEAR